MNDFIKFSQFQKQVNVSPIMMWRTFKKLRDGEFLQQEIDWRLEGGALYVIPARLYLEAQKLRPEIEYVNVKSDEIKVNSDGGEKAKEESTESISNNDKVNDDFKRNQMKSFEIKSEVVTLLKEQIDGLKNDKKYLQEQVTVKSEEVANANKERAFLMQNWQTLVHENDDLRRQLTSGKGEIKVKSDEITEQEIISEQKLESEVGGGAKVVSYTTPSQSPQTDHHETFMSDEENSPPSMSESHTGQIFEEGGTPPPQNYGEGEKVVPTTSV